MSGINSPHSAHHGSVYGSAQSSAYGAPGYGGPGATAVAAVAARGSSSTTVEEGVQALHALRQRFLQQLARRVRGHQGAADAILAALLCGGHVLIEDRPGVGKTELAKSIAQCLDLQFRRIQGNPDVLPTDILGTRMPDPRTGAWDYQPGPIMSQVVLVDEINRATPKTQSALLEAMEEGQVTVDGEGHPLPQPFILLATQNPMEYEGTYPLPEVQLDRFLLRIELGLLPEEDEVELIASWSPVRPHLEPVVAALEILRLRDVIQQVPVGPVVAHYISDLLQATRQREVGNVARGSAADADLRLGLSPRAGVRLRQAAQAWAALCGDVRVTEDHVQAVFPLVATHRLVPVDGQTDASVIVEEILRSVVPTHAEHPGARKAGFGRNMR